MSDQAEEPLTGGLESARVSRLGDRVFRPAGPWTPTIHALLAHLQAKAFPAPRPLGLDDAGREVVSFIEGRAGNWPWPPALIGARGVTQIAELLARYHQAAADFSPPAPAVWRQGPGDLTPPLIPLHADFAPYNLIWRGDELVGVIDWDLARPGLPIEDAGFAVIQCAPLHPRVDPLGFESPPDRRGRLEIFARVYGRFSAEDLARAALDAHQSDIARMERLGSEGVEPRAAWAKGGLLERTRQDAEWLRGWARAERLHID